MKPAVAVAAVALLALAGAAIAQERSTFSIRALATEDYDEDGVKFDLKAERERLRTWLSVEGNKRKLEHEPLFINTYNDLGAEQGGPLSQEFAWLPRRILPDRRFKDMWNYSISVDYPKYGAIALFSDSEWNDRVRTDIAREYLLEFIPINMHSTHFTQKDFDQGSVRPALDSRGSPAVSYGIRADRQDAYEGWTGSMIGKKAAIIIDGIVLLVPEFAGRIRSVGQISGDFSEEEAVRLSRSLGASVGAGDAPQMEIEVMIRARIALAQLLHDEDEQVRVEAAASLQRLGDQATYSVAQLIRALGDESLRVRSEVITALGIIGPAANDAIPALEALTEHDDPQIAERAKAALRQIRR